MSDTATVWRIEYWVSTGPPSQGVFAREYIEDDDQAETRLMVLAVDQILSDGSGLNVNRKSRARSWLRWKRPDTQVEDTHGIVRHVRHLEAWRLVEGEWREVSWVLTEPDIEVTIAASEAPS